MTNNKYPLTKAQERIVFDEILHESSSFYNENVCLTINGNFDKEILKDTILFLLEIHHPLRVQLFYNNGKIYQKVCDSFEDIYKFADLTESSENEINEYLKSSAKEPFNIFEQLPTRIELIQCKNNKYFISFNWHHMIIDRGAAIILLQQISKIYISKLEHSFDEKEYIGTSLTELKSSEDALYSHEFRNSAESYWSNKLRDLDGHHYFMQKSFDQQNNYEGCLFDVEISEDLALEIKKFLRAKRGTFFIYLMTVFSTLIYRYSNTTKKIAINYPVSGRFNKYTIKAVSGLVNTIPMILNYQCLTFSDLFEEIKKIRKLDKKFENFDYREILKSYREINNKNAMSISNLSISNSLNKLAGFHLPGTSAALKRIHPDISRYDLSLIYEEDNGYKLSIEYKKHLYSIDTIKNIASHVLNIMTDSISDPNRSIYDLCFLSEVDRKVVNHYQDLSIQNSLQVETIISLLSETFEKNAELVAIEDGLKKITYGDIDNYSNKLAEIINDNQITNSAILISLSSTFQIIVSMIGIWKSGNYFCCMNPDRNQRTINNESKLKYKAVISDALDSTFDSNIVNIDPSYYINDEPSKFVQLNTEDFRNKIAYIVFTSGTTGLSKGVVVGHQGLVNLVNEQVHTFKLHSKSRVLQFFSVYFDGFLSEMLTTLYAGGTLVVTSDEVKRDPNKCIEFLYENQITSFSCIPNMLARMPFKFDYKFESIVMAGEKTSNTLIQKLLAVTDRLVNAYGPSEVTVCSTMKVCNDTDDNNIGFPIKNLGVVILDPKYNLVPIGALGDIWITGIGLANGYLDDLNNSNFQQLQLPGQEARIYYRTGDIGFYHKDGSIEYHGRADRQHKVNGFRVDLNEIENVISKFQYVERSHVIVSNTKSNVSQIIAYVVGNNLNKGSILEYMKIKLPSHMLPHKFVFLDFMPVTKQGKIDYQQLYFIENENASADNSSIVLTDIEQKIAEAFSHTLNIDIQNISKDDDIWTLGGDSISAAQFVNYISRKYKFKLKVFDVLNRSNTLSKLAQLVSEVDLEGKDSTKCQTKKIMRI